MYRKRKGKESNDENEYEYEILLIQRKNPPFQGNFALPGGFVEYNESVEEACIREAKEETNLDVQIEKLIGVYSKPDRDPRGHTITAAFLCIPPENLYPLAGDDAKNAKFFRISEILNMQLTSFRSDISKSDDFKMAFDHKYIIEDALKFLKEKR
ncbi:MAG: hypothetical protein BWK75_06985 [Candidatus Altiarchaeales archaeon A3]|nr:MAG: hypothetical protein BWK75_06985 [Candidatus Altiarchaeales archaeon A3]